jgi:hypothetical protein
MKWRKVGGSAGGRAGAGPGVAVSVSVMREIYIGVSNG